MMTAEISPPGKLIDVLADRYPQTSKRGLKLWIIHGKVKVNGIVRKEPHYSISSSDKIEYCSKAGMFYDPVQSLFFIHYEDKNLIIVDKPPGLLTYGEKGAGGTSMYKNLLENLRTRQGKPEKVYVVHRLDREVSGILVFAKNEKVQQLLKAGWKDITRKYLALVEGNVEKEMGTIRSYLMESPDLKVFSTRKMEGARLAITHYKVIRRFKDYTLLEIELETGRKNQIRVHLSEMGNPVVGDYRYGADGRVRRRIRLHAYFLEFRHPVTGKTIRIEGDIPKSFTSPGLRDEHYK